MDARENLQAQLRGQGLAPLKRYGQHFLVDDGATDRLVAAIVPAGTAPRVLEIGPGPGTLTGRLLAAGATVLALEIDRGLADQLGQSWSGARLSIVVGDALKLDWGELVQRHLGPGPVTLAGNLPYYITGPLIARLWEPGAPPWERAVLMLQREAADRLLAEPGTAGAGVPSVLVRTVAHVARVFDIAPSAFFPRPRVWSTVVELVAREPELPWDPALWSQVVHAGFGQRRKMLRTTLSGLGGDPGWWTERLAARGIDARLRAEALSLAEWQQVVAVEADRRQGPAARKNGGGPDVV